MRALCAAHPLRHSTAQHGTAARGSACARCTCIENEMGGGATNSAVICAYRKSFLLTQCLVEALPESDRHILSGVVVIDVPVTLAVHNHRNVRSLHTHTQTDTPPLLRFRALALRGHSGKKKRSALPVRRENASVCLLVGRRTFANCTSTRSSTSIPLEIREVRSTEALSCDGVLAPSVQTVSAPVGSSSSDHGASRSTRTSIVVSFVARRRSARRGSFGSSSGCGGGPAVASAQPCEPAGSIIRSSAARNARANALNADSSWWWAFPPRTFLSEISP